jgi:GT2 family glycosyltransferase
LLKTSAPQTHKDLEVICQIVVDDGGCKEYIAEHYPSVKILEPGYNIGFARGHNEIFAQSDSDFFQLVNPDLILRPTYIAEVLRVFENPNVAAVQGKLIRYDFASGHETGVIDSAGIVVQKSGRARSRGQHEQDRGQYEELQQLLACEGSCVMYRRRALEVVAYPRSDGRKEYFDEDFHSYWEDTDLGWRLVSAGFSCIYEPKAMALHGRGAGSSPGGYKKVLAFVRHHKTISPWVRRLNYKNHILLFVKNSPKWYFAFFAREFFMLGYIVVFEIKTLAIVPTLLRQLPLMFRKRKFIREQRKISVARIEQLLVK